VSGLLAIEDTGHGDTLVLVHGLATTRQIWSMVVPTLALTRRVVTLDVPGFGESVPAGPGFDLSVVADRIARGLAAQGVKAPFDLVGHSLGAGLAVTLAAARPRSVRRLVLAAPAGIVEVPKSAALMLAATAEGLLAARRRLGSLADLRWGRRLLLALATADGGLIAPTQARLIIDASAGARRIAPALAAITRAQLLPVLRDVKAPLGVIWGAEDRTIPARNVALIREVRPELRVAMIEHAGHIPMVERPDAFVAALEGLLAGLDKETTTLGPDPFTVR
jgi:pimeloyl-ACP methyl ester carboxylesterase